MSYFYATFCTKIHIITPFRPNFTQIHYLDQFSQKLPISVKFHGPPYPLKKSKLFPWLEEVYTCKDLPAQILGIMRQLFILAT